MSNNRITFTLNELVSGLNGYADHLLRAEFDITYSQFIFLLSIRDRKKSLTESAQFQGVSVAAVSKRIGWFEERKLVTCTNNPAHGRKSLLGLTAKGIGLVDKSSDFLELTFRSTFSDVKGINLGELDKQLQILLNHFYLCINENEVEK